MRTCKICGKELIRQKVYCSRSCFSRDADVLNTCVTCGKQFRGYHATQYCSRECMPSRGKEYRRAACLKNRDKTTIEREVDRIQVDRFFKAFESSHYRQTMPVVAFVKAIVQTADTAGMHGRYAKRRDEVKKLQKGEVK